MKRWMIVLGLAMFSVQGALAGVLDQKVWNHGSADCDDNREPPIEIFRFDADTYILRQNKCVHFEAPFIYVLFGERTVFIQDTGATAEPELFPLYDVVHDLISQREGARGAEPLQVLVTHSHGHGDHTAADPQFRGKAGVTLIEPTAEALRKYFRFVNWPEESAKIDLGGRELVVIPVPGHHEQSVAVYDAKTGWLLTGDTLYPGYLYIKNWDEYRKSIRRLVEFSKTRRISAILGTHVEMSSTPGKAYPRGSTFQPNEARLAMTAEDLLRLDESLRRAGETPQEIATAKFIVTPISAFQRGLGAFLKWLLQ